MTVSPETILRILLFLLYVPVCLLMYRLLVHRLSPAAKRLAVFMLAAQVLVIIVAIEHLSASGTRFWLWHLDLEWNIPSVLSSTQLALVGGIALAAAWFSRAGAAWQRLYLVALGLFFLILGLEEFFSWKDTMSEAAWRRNYAILGAAVSIVTAFYAAHTPASARAWLILLLSGLSLIALGGGFIDSLPEVCGDIGLLRIDGCFYLYRSPEEIIEILGAWVALLALLSRLSQSKSPLPPRLWWLLCLFPLLWILLLIHYSPVNDLTVPPPAQPASVQFESNVHLHGFQMDKRGLPASAYLFLPYGVDSTKLGFSVHLVDQITGDSLASREIIAHRRYAVMPGGRGYEPVYAQAIDLPLPANTAVNRALWVVMSHWREIGDQFLQQAILTSDHQLLNNTQVILDELVLRAEPPAASGEPIAVFGSSFALEDVALPTLAQAGDTADFRFSWRANTASNEDYMQFLHFVHRTSGKQWGFDQPPLGPRLPTRLWYSGLADSETWAVPLLSALEPGMYKIFTGLYRLTDLERLPATDTAGVPFVDARVPLGELIVTG